MVVKEIVQVSNYEAGPIDLRRYLQWPAALLLSLAAVLKVHQLATSPYVDNLVFESRAIALVIGILEILMAAWLLSNWISHFSRVISIVIFTAFCMNAFGKYLAGEISCGCFGSIEVPPLLTAALDLAVIGTLYSWQPDKSARRPSLMLVALTSLFVMIAAMAALNFSSRSLTDLGDVVGEGEVVVVDTEHWVGKRLPLIRFIHGKRKFLQGKWLLVLYHADCPVCQRLIDAAIQGPLKMPIAFVEVPPFQSPNRSDRSDLIWRKLSDGHQWFVTAPEILELDDGVVKQCLGHAMERTVE